MNPTGKWCPICALPAHAHEQEKGLCVQCQGTGEIRCSECLCLECGGTGLVRCTGCVQGQVDCPTCGGKGHTKGLFGKSNCKSCNGTGKVEHETCNGVGAFPCTSCAGLGHEHECDACDSSGRTTCLACYGAGLAPSEGTVHFGYDTMLPLLLQQLPERTSLPGGERLPFHDVMRRIVTFLGYFHWTLPRNHEAGEHEMALLEDRVHFRTAVLQIARGTPAIEYRFLDVIRLNKDTYQVVFNQSTKRWR